MRTDIAGADDGPLAGRTVAIKDNIEVAGVPMMNGSTTLEGFVPRRDATVVSRLLAAGATVTGKAVCEDLCFSGGSHTSVTGPVRNPWDPARTTGGSSSGSAALVASGEVDLALGGDVAGLRVGVVAQGFDWAELSEPGVDDTVRAAAARLGELGIEVVDVDLPWHRHALHVWNVIATDGVTVQMIDGNGYGHSWDGLYDPELIEHYGRQRREVADRWSPTVTMVAMAGRWSAERLQGRHYAMARDLAFEVRRQYDAGRGDVDLLVLPTVPMVVRPIPAPDDPLEVRVARALEMIVNTAPFDVSGHPAISVPAGLSEGLPVGMMLVGMMLVGRRFEDATCLWVAHAFEQLVGGFPAPLSREPATV